MILLTMVYSIFSTKKTFIHYVNVVTLSSMPFTEPESPSTNAADSDEDPAHPPASQDALRPLPAIEFMLGDFTRRFERQSWRIRHEEERRRLKQKFEVSCVDNFTELVHAKIICMSTLYGLFPFF